MGRTKSAMHKIAKLEASATPPARFVCVHGHFYQPPRENPWLETVEVQDSAAPYHDWNDRITAECYAPNGASRITAVTCWVNSAATIDGVSGHRRYTVGRLTPARRAISASVTRSTP